MSRSKARIGLFGQSQSAVATGSERIARERLKGRYGLEMGDIFHARRQGAPKPAPLPSFADNDNFEPGYSAARAKAAAAMRIVAGASFWLAVGYAVYALLPAV